MVTGKIKNHGAGLCSDRPQTYQALIGFPPPRPSSPPSSNAWRLFLNIYPKIECGFSALDLLIVDIEENIFLKRDI